MSKQKHIAIKASKKSISSMILSILMLLSVIPLHSSTIFAESTKKTVMNGTGNIQKTDSIWFGIRGKDLTGAGSEIQWRVLDTNTNIGEDGIFLLSEKLIGKSDFSKGWKASRKWQGSDAQKWCKDFSGENGDNSLKSLSDQELAAIKPTTESNPGKIAPYVPFHPKEKYALKEDKVFFPSVGEAGKYFQTDDERIAYDGNNPEKWWLRSPHKSLIQNVRIVKQNGGISYSNVKSKLATRPAFNLDTTKVLFTSPAVDGKQSNAAGDALKAVEDTDTTEWKLTLIDRNRTFQLDTDNGEKVTIAGNILTIPYKDATTGTNEYISAVVEKNGSITYYGRLKAVENSNTDKNGEVTVQLPADFDKTTDTLYLINEQLNGDKKTDYSSEKVEVKIPTKHKITVIDGTTDKITAAEGEQVRVAAIQKENKVFDKWEANGIQLTEEQKTLIEITFTMPDKPVTLTAKFKDKPAQPQEYTVIMDTDGNGTAKSMVGGAEVTKAEQGKEVTITATPDREYTFDKWEVISGGIQVADEDSATTTFTMPDKDVEVKAHFKQGQQPPQPQPTKHNIKLTDDGNGTAKSMVGGAEVTKAEQGKEVTITATPDRGYTFDKWEVISGGIQVADEDSATTTFTMPDKDVEVKAHFKQGQQPPQPQPTKYKVQLTNDGNGTAKSMVGGAEVTKAEQGKEVTITATPDRGYTFDKWEVISGGIQVADEDSATTTFTMPDKDVEVKAHFKQGQQPPQPPQPQPTKHNIKLTDDGNGTAKSMVGGAEVTKAEQGKEVTITATPDRGYTFDKWEVISGGIQVADEDSATTTFTMPDKDVEVKAHFKQGQQPPQPPQPQPTKHNIKLTDDGNGTAKSMVGGAEVTKAEQGKEVTITATPDRGYTFDKWEVISGGIQVADEDSATTTFTMPDKDVEVKAHFKQGQQPPQPQPTKYKVQLTNDGNGTATASSSQAEQGKKVTITATPDRGYKFDEWRVLSGGIRLRDKDSATTTFTMPNRDVEIKAYFKKKSSEGSSHDAEYYNITTKTDKHGTVEARSKAREGTEVSVIVDPDKGYKLDEITVTDRRGRDITIKETNRENRYKFTMPARDVTVEATFKQIKQEQPSKPTTPPTIPPTNNNKPTENNIIKKQQTTVFTIGSNIMTVITDGKATQTTIDAKPFLSQGRVMIPVRYAAESLGMQVEWNKQTQTVVLKDRENTVMIPIKTNKIIVGNQEYTSDVTPILKNGRTYLTISNIAKALRMRAGQDVKWDNKIKQVTIIKEVEVR